MVDIGQFLIEIVRTVFGVMVIISLLIYGIFTSLISPLMEENTISITKDLDGDGKNETIFTEQGTKIIYLHIHKGGFIFKDKWKSGVLCSSWEGSCITTTLRIFDIDSDGVDEITIITYSGFPTEDYAIYIFDSKTRELEVAVTDGWRGGRTRLFKYVDEGRKLNITIEEALERYYN